VQDLFALFFPMDVESALDLTINLPGTDSSIGNPMANFSRRFPPIPKLTEDADFVRVLAKVNERKQIEIPFPERLESSGSFFTFINSLKNRKVFFSDPNNGGILTEYSTSDRAILELVIGNEFPDTQEGYVYLDNSYSRLIDQNAQYKLIDLASPQREEYIKSGKELLEGFYTRLDANKDHHFIVERA
jgi:hypothetical protein